MSENPEDPGDRSEESARYTSVSPVRWTVGFFALALFSKFLIGHFDSGNLIGNAGAGTSDPSAWAGPALLLSPFNFIQAGVSNSWATAPVTGAVLTALGVAVVLVVLVMLPRSRMIAVPAAAVLAGALSNLADRAGLWAFEAPRLMSRAAIDWYRLGGYNLADLLIGWGGTFLLAGIAWTLIRRHRITWVRRPLAVLRRHREVLAGVTALALVGSLGGAWVTARAVPRSENDQNFTVSVNTSSEAAAWRLALEYRLLRSGGRSTVCAHLRDQVPASRQEKNLDELCARPGPIPAALIPSYVTYEICADTKAIRDEVLGVRSCPSHRILTTGPLYRADEGDH